MCLIVHKPADSPLPEALLVSAVEFNPHGAGLIAWHPASGAIVRRSAESRIDELAEWVEETRGHECIFHFRYRTRGDIDLANTHPLQVTDDIFVVHNGTLTLDMHTPARSDTWHLCQDFLQPLLSRRPTLLDDPVFQRMLAAAIGPLNKLVLADIRRKIAVIINREAGTDVEGLRLSNMRWFDPNRLGWQQTQTAPDAVLNFLS